MLNYIKFSLLLLTICLTQVSTPSSPKSFYIDEAIQLSTITLPSFDVNQFLIEDDNEMRSKTDTLLVKSTSEAQYWNGVRLIS